jgi:hypothetical protein
MNIWVLILLVFALVFCIIQSLILWFLTPAPRPAPHFGWLGVACLIGAILLMHPLLRGTG